MYLFVYFYTVVYDVISVLLCAAEHWRNKLDIFSVANFRFRLQVFQLFCSQFTNYLNLWKLMAARFHLQLASLLFSI